MSDLKTENNLSSSQKKTYEFIKKTWEIDGYNFTKEDEARLLQILKNETTADVEVEKIIKKHKRGSDDNA